MSSGVMPGLDPTTGLLSLPWWAAAVIAAFMVVCFILALSRAGLPGVMVMIAGVAVLFVAIAGVWTWADVTMRRDRAEERRALDARAFELSGRAASQGLALACLDGAAGAAVEASCEKALFANAETVAAATSYVAARVALQSSAADYARRTRANYDELLPGMRRALEADRFGFVAQVLTTAYGCSAQACGPFALFRDTARLRTNLAERAFDGFVARNSTAWATPPSGPNLAAVPPAAAPAPLTTGGPSPVPPGFKVPSASSIPPVSIMDPEPSVPLRNPPAATATETNRTAPRRTTAPRTNGNAPPPPVQIVPPGATAGNPPPAQ